MNCSSGRIDRFSVKYPRLREFLGAKRRNSLVELVVGIFLFCFVMGAEGQTTAGTIWGTVTDQSGAVVSDTPVELVQISTSTKRQALTNTSGYYQFVEVPPGDYQIVIAKQGFKQTTRGPVQLGVDSRIQVDVSLQLGSSTESVEVHGASPLIEADSSSLGTIVDERETNELPLNGRNPMNLSALAPSVVPLGQTSGSPTGVNPFGWGNYQIGGGMAGQSVVFIDGSPDNTSYLHLTALIPSQDSVQEFKVETNNLSAEYGRLAGGAINFTTKSGTSSLHGGAWEFLRNKVLNANTFYGNLAGLPKPPFTQNQYGFNLGGPIVIPHIYNGQKRTFFFINWEGFGLRQGQTITETVPTASERTGDLSALGVPIYDPLTTCGVAGGPACAPGQPQYERTAFPNAVIPTNRLNQTALLFLQQFYPLPNTAGTNGQNNLTANASGGGNNYETVARIDHEISDKQHISARYTYWKNHNLAVDPFNNGMCANGSCAEFYNINNFVIDDTYSFSQKTILNLRLSYMRFVYNRLPDRPSYSLTSLDMPSALASAVEFPGPPSMEIAGFDPAGLYAGSADSTIVNVSDNDRIAGSLIKFLGNHTLKFGGEYMRQTFNYAQNNISTGDFNFDNGFTAENPLTGVGGAGLGSFLLGYPANGSIQYVNEVASEQLYPALFLTDDWRASRKLTLHVGVRWEDVQPFTERHNRISYFDPNQPEPTLAAAGVGSVPGAVDLVASGTRSSRFGFDNSLVQFSPRLGLSFSLTQNTVFNGGYGIFWLPNDVAWVGNPGWDPTNSFSTPYAASTNNGLTPANDISNPFPNGFIQPPGRNITALRASLLGNAVGTNFLNDPYAYAQQWNAGIQQQFGKNTAVSVAYAGTKGTHLSFQYITSDQLPDQDLQKGAALLQPVANPYYGIVNSAFSLGGPTIPAGQLLRPFPQYSGVNSAANYADSDYNALEVRVQRRFAAGASINVAYALAKLQSDTDPITSWLESGGNASIQDSNNLKAEKSLSSADVPQRLVIAYVYDLPFGHGRQFGSNLPTAANYVLGGWGVEGLTTLMSGFPLGLTTAQNLTNSFGGGSRPNYTRGCSKNVGGGALRRLNGWFNTECFTQPAAFTFGDEPRNDPDLKSPGVANWDFSAVKELGIGSGDRFKIQFRAEFFNLFNRVQFGYPGTTQGVANFGVISSQANLPRIIQFGLRANF